MKDFAVRLFAVAVFVWLTLTLTVQAQAPATLITLHNFTGSDGAAPRDALVQGSDGDFYGTTTGDPGNDTGSQGTVFRITPAGVLTTLHNFSSLSYNDTNDDGAFPGPSLVQGSDGNFYGTTSEGGNSSGGTVFSITPAGVLTTLHNFNPLNGSPENIDGYAPNALVQGSDGNFYGTTGLGGSGGSGTVFSITPSGVFTTLHNFSDTDENDSNDDGANPQAALVEGSSQIFYGTTSHGGVNGSGTLFSITPAGVLTTLHKFTGDDGWAPLAALVRSSDGNFYGATVGRGSSGGGTLFSITPAGVLTTLHNFAGTGDDGSAPSAALVLGSDGNIYGTTADGGSNNGGTVFQLTPAGVLTTLHTFGGFDNNGDNGDGAQSNGLVQGSDGDFYGTTPEGGSGGEGTVFRLTLPPAFFTGEAELSNGVCYLSFASGGYFGYYSFLSDPHYIYHFDLGYEYVFDANDGKAGIYLYDFASQTFFYTSPVFPFPYLYDFTLNSVLYYYPDPTAPGHYNTNGVRYFYDFATGKIITK